MIVLNSDSKVMYGCYRLFGKACVVSRQMSLVELSTKYSLGFISSTVPNRPFLDEIIPLAGPLPHRDSALGFRL